MPFSHFFPVFSSIGPSPYENGRAFAFLVFFMRGQKRTLTELKNVLKHQVPVENSAENIKNTIRYNLLLAIYSTNVKRSAIYCTMQQTRADI